MENTYDNLVPYRTVSVYIIDIVVLHGINMLFGVAHYYILY